VVLVEHEAYGNPTLDRRLERGEQRVRGRVLEAQVIDRDVERLLGAVDERGDPRRDGVRLLTAVGQEEEVERRY
jgi:hypothetical protein